MTREQLSRSTCQPIPNVKIALATFTCSQTNELKCNTFEVNSGTVTLPDLGIMYLL